MATDEVMRSWGHEPFDASWSAGNWWLRKSSQRVRMLCSCAHCNKAQITKWVFHIFPPCFSPWKIPWKFRDLHGFPIIFHGFPMENPIFPTSRMRSHGEALSYVCPCPALGGLPKTWSFQSPEALAPWHDPEMGRWDVGDIVCIYI